MGRCMVLVLRQLRPFRSLYHLGCTRALLSRASDDIVWPVGRVRSTFIDYFKDRHMHQHIPSSSVVPYKDDSIIFANAGMNQFKTIFTGTIEPKNSFASLSRAVNSQKCIRAGGKHNDLADVGKDVYHHTFFEMLGTWSFGNYFKKESIEWAFELLVDVYGLPKDRLYVTYFAGNDELGIPADEEVRRLWMQYLPEERILPFGMKENFWEMGDVGPCGPASEIHFDRVGERNAAYLVNTDDPDVLEIWNLVFMQYNRDVDGSLKNLPQMHVDTGMGLERLTSILQNKRSNYDTDIFNSLFKSIHSYIGGEPYSGKIGADDAESGYRDMAYRVLADHARTLTIAIADGALPSNEGRGYVLRRILRRAFRYTRQNLKSSPELLVGLVPVVVSMFESLYPELKLAMPDIISVIAEEERSFSSMLDRGISHFNEAVGIYISSDSGMKIIPGSVVFFMYDSLGFPPDLTALMAEERGMTIDYVGFEAAMEQQRIRSRDAEAERRYKLLKGMGGTVTNLSLDGEMIAALQTEGIPPTIDTAKYTYLPTKSSQFVTDGTVVLKIVSADGAFVDKIAFCGENRITFGLILSETPFYAEAGGQVGDTGYIKLADSVISLRVLDTQSYGGYVVHICSNEVVSTPQSRALTELLPGNVVQTFVDIDRRSRIANNHTFTHLLNHALLQVIGSGVQQQGSSVSEARLRFDFNMIRQLTQAELETIEFIVNRAIRDELCVYSMIVPLQSAQRINGIRAVFGETYPDPVRIVSIGVPVDDLLLDPGNNRWSSVSVELCGGTHAEHTGLADHFVITEESAISKGTRRISAVTGDEAITAIRRSDELNELVSKIKWKMNDLQNETNHARSLEYLDRIDEDLQAVRRSIDGHELPLTKKQYFRDTHDSMNVLCKKLFKKLILSSAEEVISQCVRDAVSSAVLHCPYVGALALPSSVGINASVVKDVVENIEKENSNLSFMIFFLAEGCDKISCVSHVAACDSDKCDATSWLKSVITPFFGKCGGRANNAQGSLHVKSIVNEACDIRQTEVDTAVNVLVDSARNKFNIL